MESWGYARVSSTEQQVDKGALRKQIERLRGAGCSKIYWDIQSRTTETRDGFERMIKDISESKRGAIASIKFTRLDRVGSSPKLFYSLLEILRSLGIRLHALDQAIDPDTLGGELTIDILLAAAKFEVKMTTERLKSDRRHRRNQGKSHRIAPFGYQVEGDRYIKDSQLCVCLIEGKREFTVSGLARYLFDIFFQVGSIHGTCNKFHEDFGITLVVSGKWKKETSSCIITDEDLLKVNFTSQTKNYAFRYPKTGLHFSITGMRNLLVNPIYAGGTLYNSFFEPNKNKSRNRQRKHFDEWEVTWNTHDDEAIITYQEHELVKSLIRGNRNNRWATNDPKDINPFSRLLNCNICGASMTRHAKRVSKDGSSLHYYQCRRWKAGGCTNNKMINSRKLEEQVIDLLVKEAERLASKIEIEDTPIEEPAELIALRRSLAELQKMPFNNAIENAKEDIRQQINAFVVKNKKPKSMSTEYILTAFLDSRLWMELSPMDKQRALRECIKRILIEGELVVKIDFL
ncbi:MAG: fdxN element excision recombinase XisF [Nostoc sp.]|uniref:fdxN element excision recombinase XisF n=1 Tax=Nostoc sp. TaxID=1180 RepID=UPI002FEFAFF8